MLAQRNPQAFYFAAHLALAVVCCSLSIAPNATSQEPGATRQGPGAAAAQDADRSATAKYDATQDVATQNIGSIEAAIADLDASAFDTRRRAFLEIWRYGDRAMEAVQAATQSDNLQIAKTARTLETLLLLNVTSDSIGGLDFELLIDPMLPEALLLCEHGNWRLVERLLKTNSKLSDALREPLGILYLSRVVDAAFNQGDPDLAWPIVRHAASPKLAVSRDLSVWLAERLQLPLTETQLTSPTTLALQSLYRGQTEEAWQPRVPTSVQRMIITRYGQWDKLSEKKYQALLLRETDSVAAKAAAAVLLEFSGQVEASDAAWAELLGVGEQPDEDTSREDSEEASGEDPQIAAALELMRDASPLDSSQLILALIISGRTTAVERYLTETMPEAAYPFFEAGNDSASAMRSVGLELDASNFASWLQLRTALVGSEAAEPIRGTSRIGETAQICRMLCGLGFDAEARQTLEMLAEEADWSSSVWTDSILRWLNRAEPRDLCLSVLGENLSKMPPEAKRSILPELFPEFEKLTMTLLQEAPELRLVDGTLVPELEQLDYLHRWDVEFFAERGSENTVSDWLARASQNLTRSGAGEEEPELLVERLTELAKLARGCNLFDLALRIAETDIRQLGATPGTYQTHWLEAAKLYIETSRPDEATQILRKLRMSVAGAPVSSNASDSQLALLTEVKALILAGKYEQALKLDRSRWLRALSTDRYPQAVSYAEVVDRLIEQSDMRAAEEFAKVAFELCEYSALDVFWAASNYSRILEDQDRFAESADVLRAPLVEALMQQSAIIGIFARNGLYNYPRWSAQAERLHRAVACIEAGDFTAASRHIRVGRKLQPQDIEMVVQCYPRLIQAGQTEMASQLFDEFESSLLQQLQQWPSDAMASNNLAWMYARCDRKLDEALELAYRATSLSPRSAIYLDTVAEIQYRLGQPQQAIATVQDCLRLEPRDQHYQDNLQRFQTPHQPLSATAN